MGAGTYCGTYFLAGGENALRTPVRTPSVSRSSHAMSAGALCGMYLSAGGKNVGAGRDARTTLRRGNRRCRDTGCGDGMRMRWYVAITWGGAYL